MPSNQGEQSTIAPLDRLLNGGRLQLLDIGARGGLHPRWRRFAGYIDAVGFDADEHECARLNGLPVVDGARRRFLPYAVAGEVGQRQFHVCRAPGSSSLYAPNRELIGEFSRHLEHRLEVVATEPLKVLTLDPVTAKEGLAPDVIKLDVQGAELEILHAGTRTLATTFLVEAELEFSPIYVGQPVFADFDVFMRSRGWVLLGLRRTVWRRREGVEGRSTSGGQLMYGDALYYNASLLQNTSSQQLLVRWLMSLSAYRQYDMIVQLLNRNEATVSESSALIDVLIPREPPLAAFLKRLVRPVLRRIDQVTLRTWADALRTYPAEDWHDPDFF